MKIKDKVGEIPISNSNKIMIHTTELKDRNKIDIRNWFLNESTGEWLPTKKGITLEYKQKEDFIRLLNLIDT